MRDRHHLALLLEDWTADDDPERLPGSELKLKIIMITTDILLVKLPPINY